VGLEIRADLVQQVGSENWSSETEEAGENLSIVELVGTLIVEDPETALDADGDFDGVAAEIIFIPLLFISKIID